MRLKQRFIDDQKDLALLSLRHVAQKLTTTLYDYILDTPKAYKNLCSVIDLAPSEEALREIKEHISSIKTIVEAQNAKRTGTCITLEAEEYVKNITNSLELKNPTDYDLSPPTLHFLSETPTKDLIDIDLQMLHTYAIRRNPPIPFPVPVLQLFSVLPNFSTSSFKRNMHPLKTERKLSAVLGLTNPTKLEQLLASSRAIEEASEALNLLDVSKITTLAKLQETTTLWPLIKDEPRFINYIETKRKKEQLAKEERNTAMKDEREAKALARKQELERLKSNPPPPEPEVDPILGIIALTKLL